MTKNSNNRIAIPMTSMTKNSLLSMDSVALLSKNISQNCRSWGEKWTRRSCSFRNCKMIVRVCFNRAIEIREYWKSKHKTSRNSRGMQRNCRRRTSHSRMNRETSRSKSRLKVQVVPELAKAIQKTLLPTWVKPTTPHQILSNIASRGLSIWQIGRRKSVAWTRWWTPTSLPRTSKRIWKSSMINLWRLWPYLWRNNLASIWLKQLNIRESRLWAPHLLKRSLTACLDCNLARKRRETQISPAEKLHQNGWVHLVHSMLLAPEVRWLPPS